MEKLIAGESDLDYTVAVEIVPKIDLANFKDYKLTRLTADVADSEIGRGHRPQSPTRTNPSRRGARAARSKRATASPSPTPVPSTASPSMAAPATTLWC